MKQRKVSELILDFGVYPRGDVDSQHVSYLKEAIDAGARLPAIIIDIVSKRVVDGFHRVRAYLSLYGPDHLVEVIEKRYKSEADLFTDAMRYNAGHGRALTRYDRTHCIILGSKLGMTVDSIASALNMTIDKVKEFTVDKVGTFTVNQAVQPVPLKRTIAHLMSGKALTPAQNAANKKLSGMQQVFYVNQIILLIESDMLDTGNVDLMKALHKLAGLIRTVSRGRKMA